MSITAEVDFIRSVTMPPWPADRASGEEMLAGMGLVCTGPAEGQDSVYTSYGLSGSFGTADNVTFLIYEGRFVAIHFFMGSSGYPNDPSTRRAYDGLCVSVSEEFGAGKRVWDDAETPLLWHVGELDIGAQLFDRHESTVMVSIEHRERAERMEQAARTSRQARGHSEQ